MNIGDKVRLLHGSEEGRIVGFKSKDIVEIEIDDGFVIPAVKNEVVLVARDEGDYFGEKNSGSTWQETGYRKPSTHAPAENESIKGLFMGFASDNDQEYAVHIINVSDRSICFAVSEYYKTNSKGLGAGMLEPGQHKFIGYFRMDQFEKWPDLVIQLLYFNRQIDNYSPPFEHILKFKASSFFKHKGNVPVINKKGYLLEIPTGTSSKIDASALRSSLTERAEQPSLQERPQKQGGSSIIDLHADALFIEEQKLKNEEVLHLQIEAFEKALDQALIQGKDSLKVIHGVGNGTLRHQIHKKLSSLQNIRYFEDADKEKFGYGATIVHLL